MTVLVPLLTPQELAERYRINRKKINKLAREGKIPAIKIGNVWRFEPKEIRAWEKRNQSEKTPDSTPEMEIIPE